MPLVQAGNWTRNEAAKKQPDWASGCSSPRPTASFRRAEPENTSNSGDYFSLKHESPG